MSTLADRTTSRRRFLAAGGASVAAALLPGCAPDALEQNEAAGGEGSWSFTDDLDKEISLAARPERIAAHSETAPVLWDYGIRPAVTYGPKVSVSYEWGDFDPTTAENVGTSAGELDLDKYVKSRPDLMVVASFGGGSWFGDGIEQEKVEKVAPIASIEVQDKPLSHSIRRFHEIAVALGGDRKAAQTAKKSFDDASTELREAAAAKKDLRVIAIWTDKDNIWVAKPDAVYDLGYYRELGVGLVDVTGGKDPYWEQLSWENADKHPADLILYDARDSYGPLPLDEAKRKFPTFRQLPAVRAGQVADWHHMTPLSYPQMAKSITALTTVVRGARANLG